MLTILANPASISYDDLLNIASAVDPFERYVG
jgi:hypothetical protein